LVVKDFSKSYFISNNKKPLLQYYKFLINKLCEIHGKDDIFNQNLFPAFQSFLNNPQAISNDLYTASFHNDYNTSHYNENTPLSKSTIISTQKKLLPSQPLSQRQKDISDTNNRVIVINGPNGPNDPNDTNNTNDVNDVNMVKYHKKSLNSINATIPITPIFCRENKNLYEHFSQLSVSRSTKKQNNKQIDHENDCDDKENNPNFSIPFPHHRKSTSILQETKNRENIYSQVSKNSINQQQIRADNNINCNNEPFQELQKKYQSLQKDFNEQNEKIVFQQKENETKQQELIERLKNCENEIVQKNEVIINLQQKLNTFELQFRFDSNGQHNNNNHDINSRDNDNFDDNINNNHFNNEHIDSNNKNDNDYHNIDNNNNDVTDADTNTNTNTDANDNNTINSIIFKIKDINYEFYIQNQTLSELRVVELKEFLKANHLSTRGTKSELIDKITQYYDAYSKRNQ